MPGTRTTVRTIAPPADSRSTQASRVEDRRQHAQTRRSGLLPIRDPTASRPSPTGRDCADLSTPISLPHRRFAREVGTITRSAQSAHKLGWFEVWRSRHYVCWRYAWWCPAARCRRWFLDAASHRVMSLPRRQRAAVGCDPLDRLRRCSAACRAQVGEEASDCRGARSDRRTSGSG
jgi:hypothetical protein